MPLWGVVRFCLKHWTSQSVIQKLRLVVPALLMTAELLLHWRVEENKTCTLTIFLILTFFATCYIYGFPAEAIWTKVCLSLQKGVKVVTSHTKSQFCLLKESVQTSTLAASRVASMTKEHSPQNYDTKPCPGFEPKSLLFLLNKPIGFFFFFFLRN